MFSEQQSSCVPSTLNCRHVQKTGDIKEFVIIEEGGIAKGIRRMVAVTGPEAAAATASMDAAEKQLADAKAMSDPKAKEAAIKALTRVCRWIN